jgi:hypothetical protein
MNLAERKATLLAEQQKLVQLQQKVYLRLSQIEGALILIKELEADVESIPDSTVGQAGNPEEPRVKPAG